MTFFKGFTLSWSIRLSWLVIFSGCNQEGGGRWEHYSSGGSFVGARPSASPDGVSIVYSSPRSGRGDLYKLNIKSRRSSRLTSEPAYEGDPQYSKDGNKIVFVRERNGIGHIWIMGADGADQRQLTNGLEYDESPALSPDGSKVVFSRSVNDPKFRPGTGAASEIFVMNADGSGQRRLTDNERPDGGASFSPDCKEILYSSSSKSEDICYIGIQSSVSHRIGSGSSPAFSPDGQRIVYVSGKYGREISIMKSDGSGQQMIHRSGLYHAYPSFTPDGSHVLFIEEPEGRGTGIMTTLDLGTSKVEQLSKTD